MHRVNFSIRLINLCFVCFLFTGLCLAQTDPGPRPGTAGAGSFFPLLNPTEQGVFTAAAGVFAEINSVSGNSTVHNITGEAGTGLGPTFNGNSCAQCHAQPAMGGSSPGLKSPQHPVPNPQVAVATLDGATNTVPFFITANGPVREARFISTNVNNVNAALDGGVHDLYTIQGRRDAPGCTLAQPDFAGQFNAGNVIFRIPTPLFGLGLVENTPDSALQTNLSANASQKANLGIAGRFNIAGNDGTITRFGWKAQNKSLLIFAGEAYNVESGVSNELFPNERSAVPGCVFNSTPEDHSDETGATGTVNAVSGDVINFALFMRLSAPPTPVASFGNVTAASIQNGQSLFNNIGCALCHSPSLTTAASNLTGMGNFMYHPYSDFALHHMGENLADGIIQGVANTDEFRTAPLWGVGQRLFFLHDGRTSDLLQAILAHFSANNSNRCTVIQNAEEFFANLPGIGEVVFEPTLNAQFCGSEANGVIQNFASLSASQQQDILNFLRSL